MSRRIRFRVLDQENRVVNGARLVVITDRVRVEGQTRADGYWDLYPNVSAPGLGGTAQVYVDVDGHVRVATIDLPRTGDAPDVHLSVPRSNPIGPTALDLGFLIDVTGSMSDELRYVNREVVDIVDQVRAATPQTRIRVGAMLYRDGGHAVEEILFTTDVALFARQLSRVHARGGGDYPEDMNGGLDAAMRTMLWSQDDTVRVLVVIADAPPHLDQRAYGYREAMGDASRLGIRILPVAASGADALTEYLFRALGSFTGTPFVYLTDHSGIGGRHLRPDTDRESVEMFSALLPRLLISDLRGQGMHQMNAQDGS